VGSGRVKPRYKPYLLMTRCGELHAFLAMTSQNIWLDGNRGFVLHVVIAVTDQTALAGR